MNRGIHPHKCHICGQLYICSAITHCQIEDKYAVCYNKECIEEFEHPAQREDVE